MILYIMLVIKTICATITTTNKIVIKVFKSIESSSNNGKLLWVIFSIIDTPTKYIKILPIEISAWIFDKTWFNETLNLENNQYINPAIEYKTTKITVMLKLAITKKVSWKFISIAEVAVINQ